MKGKVLMALLAAASVTGSFAAADNFYYLAYHAKNKSSGYDASGAAYVKSGGKSNAFLLVKMSESAAGDHSALGDAVYLSTDPKTKVAVEETTNLQLGQIFDSKSRALLVGAAYNVDSPQADPTATGVTCKDTVPYGSSEFLLGSKAKFLDIGLVVGGTVVEKLVVRRMHGQNSGLRCNSPVSDNFAVSASTSYKLDLDRTQLVNTSGPGGAPPATLEAALNELERTLPGGGWATL